MKPIALGSANNGTGSSAPSVSQIVVTKAGGFASPSLFNESLNGGNSLLTQFGFQNPLAPATGVACSGIATQFDVDSNDNLLIRVFQGNGEPLVDSTVTISLSPLVGSVQATTDANGIASFDGPGNTVPLASLSNITAVTVQFSINGLASSCLVQGNPPPACNTFAELTAGRRTRSEKPTSRSHPGPLANRSIVVGLTRLRHRLSSGGWRALGQTPPTRTRLHSSAGSN